MLNSESSHYVLITSAWKAYWNLKMLKKLPAIYRTFWNYEDVMLMLKMSSWWLKSGLFIVNKGIGITGWNNIYYATISWIKWFNCMDLWINIASTIQRYCFSLNHPQFIFSFYTTCITQPQQTALLKLFHKNKQCSHYCKCKLKARHHQFSWSTSVDSQAVHKNKHLKMLCIQVTKLPFKTTVGQTWVCWGHCVSRVGHLNQVGEVRGCYRQKEQPLVTNCACAEHDEHLPDAVHQWMKWPIIGLLKMF